jgi:hypothetical protein
MPLTFPSHAAAILPLLHLRGPRQLPASALVVGSTAPDLIYLIGKHGADAHRPFGLLTFCMPAGILAFLYLEGVLLPVLAAPLCALLPERARPLGSWILGPRPLPRRLGGWLAICVALLLGAASHQLWDGFTHAWMWPARVLYPGVTIPILGHPVLVSKALQHGSSAAGLLIVLLYLARSAPRKPENAPVPTERAAAVGKLLRIVAVPLLVAGIAAALTLRSPDPLRSRAIWNAAWSATAWFALLLGASCLLARLSGTRAERARYSGSGGGGTASSS